jgi:uncharacterized protein (TIGR03086 family)
MDPVDLYEQASEWTASKIKGASDQLDTQTACEEWKARDLINHLLGGFEIFTGGLKGGQITGPPDGPPPNLIGDDPVKQYEEGRQALIGVMREPGVAEKQGMLIGIAFADTLVHGWDLAKGTGQDTTMPDGLAEAAYGSLHGQLTAERRGNAFKPEVTVGDDASTQDKLVAYMGRTP